MEQFWVADNWQARAAANRLDTMTSFLRWCQGTRISWRNEGLETVRIELPVRGGENRSGYLKRYAAYRGDWRYFWRARRLQQEVSALQWLAHRGFPVPTLAAWGIRRSWGVVTAAFLLTAAIDHARMLERESAGSLSDLARLIGRLHRVGFFHGNLYARNILLQPDTGAFFLIDFPACRITPLLPIRPFLAARDLSCLLRDLELQGTNMESLFLTAYGDARWPDNDPVVRKRRVERLTRRMDRHAARRRGRLHV